MPKSNKKRQEQLIEKLGKRKYNVGCNINDAYNTGLMHIETGGAAW